ncbi:MULTISPECIES: hypothetical protein [Burkholderia cepacia complex]|uniref:hypothetical protein n=1 Tax=Burkholderia cepacia complex TaxID=87882 RepID=UPI00075A35C2|nr:MULTISPECIES: hypothetical protein [Burkholderia cepacia complex]AOI61548.1 hypothetical protein WI26_28055 [Burkholderia diffusa]KVC23262.1 hypothetical protein WI69_04080 [Burkholderia diffusa]KVG57744.1 hypothetical protein WS79_16635 [Burkholderia territorii]KVQ59369.1 hypothetical protein WT22_18875 [Burkholderia territorii]KVQ62894.1 hypothetical protein WT23_17010 [Burkholderia territorii]
MNWLSEYFAQRTSPLSLSLWAHPPLALGPDGPICREPYRLPYPGVELVFTPAEAVERGGKTYTLPARYDSRGLLAARSTAHDEAASFFREVTIFAPSQFNRDFVVTVNGEFSFVPTFWQDGSPGFSGVCVPAGSGRTTGERAGPPWLFQGYLSI